MPLDDSKIYIVGVGMTKFGLMPDRSIKEMVETATTDALSDAGVQADQVEAVFYSNVGQGVIEGQVCVPGQIALRPLGFESIPIVNVENACASGSTAAYLACMQIRAGTADIVMAIGAEKLSTSDLDKRNSVFAGGYDVHDAEAVFAKLEAMAADAPAPPVEGARSPFMDIYSYWSRAYMKDFGATQRDLAEISSKNHWHSTMNELCQFQRTFTVDEVLSARPLSYPLTVPMCSGFSDGAAAAVICSAAGVRKLRAEDRAIAIESIVLASGTQRDARDWDLHITRLAGDKAYRLAKIAPEEIDIAELHDATAFGELLNAENLRLVARGQGGPAVVSGETKLGGRIPINVSGGLESRGHPLGATGLAQIHELVVQLRGEAGTRQVRNARIGLFENGGGLLGVEEASAVVGILSRLGY
ncbi:MAG: thiolase family protein [Stenotrophobium sp.]